MSIANDLRKAATTWPLDYTFIEGRVLDGFLGIMQSQYGVSEIDFRTFMLLVASALDGGEREPMSNKTAIGLIDARWSEMDLVRFVERHHGIGINK